MNRPEPARSEEVRGLVHLARKELLRSGQTDYDAQGLERLVSAQRRAVAAGRRAQYAALIGAAAVIVAAVIGLLVVRPLRREHAAELAYAARFIDLPGQGQKALRYEFSDGTVIALRAKAELQVLSRENLTPRVRLERGEAQVKVVHRPDSHWNFSAGPFDVMVVGTAFDLSWDPSLQAFALDLQEGAVKVTGPVLDGPLLVRAGHRVSISLESRRVAIDSVLPSPSAAPPVSAVQPPQAAQLAPAAPQAPRPLGAAASATGSDVPRAPAKMSWRALVGHGRFVEVVLQAQAMPIDSCLSVCPAADLRALADAARYTGRAPLAERAYLELRRRFPGSADSSVAAFLLARTFEAQHRPQLAALWYDRYLSEAPSGEFSVEATAGRARVGD